MARKQPPPGFVSTAEFARIMGVSVSAINKAVQYGRIQAYDIDGRPWRQKPVRRARKAARTGETPASAVGGGEPDEG